jgi:hypothetical protein
MRTSILLAGAALGAVLSAPAAALTCYTVLDRNDNVIYRDTYPPVDLSEQGAAERARMRSRGEHLLAMESDRCPGIEFFIGNAGSTSLNVDQVVSGMPVRPLLGAPGVGNDQPSASSGPGTVAPSPRATTARPSAPAKR